MYNYEDDGYFVNGEWIAFDDPCFWDYETAEEVPDFKFFEDGTEQMLDELSFKDIEDYEGLYGITSCGKVWSYRAQKFLKTRTDKYGYEIVNLSKDGQSKTVSIHRLVARAYIENPSNLPCVNHIDGNKQHNYVSNLEWVSSRENNVHACQTGLRKPRSKSRKVRCIETGKIYDSCSQVARELGCSNTAVWNSCKKIGKSCRGQHFEFVEEELK